MRKRIAYLLIFFLALVALVAFNPLYFADSISGTVIDAQSGEPVAGVVVVTRWEQTGLLHLGLHRILGVSETVTDASGAFVIEGWGPRLTRHVLGRVANESPQTILFRAGYAPLFVSNFRKASRENIFFRRNLKANYDNGVFRLERLSANDPRLEVYVEALGSDIRRIVDYEPCTYLQIPRLVAEAQQLSRQFVAQDESAGYALPSVESLDPEGSCTGSGGVR
jgi:hypothetical protein